MDALDLIPPDASSEESQLGRIDAELDSGLGDIIDVLLAPYEEPEEDFGYGPDADEKRRAFLAESGYEVVDEGRELHRDGDIRTALRETNARLDAYLRAYLRPARHVTRPLLVRPRSRVRRPECVRRRTPHQTRASPDDGPGEPPPGISQVPEPVVGVAL